MRAIWIFTAAAAAALEPLALGGASAFAQHGAPTAESGAALVFPAQGTLQPLDVVLRPAAPPAVIAITPMAVVHPAPPRRRPAQTTAVVSYEPQQSLVAHAPPPPRLRPSRIPVAVSAGSEQIRVAAFDRPPPVMDSVLADAAAPLLSLADSGDGAQPIMRAAPALAAEAIFDAATVSDAPAARLAEDGLTFAADLLKALGAGGARTVMASPESLRVAMGLTALGAEPDVSAGAPLLTMRPLDGANVTEVSAANGVWASETAGLHADFVDQAQALWGAQARTVDFATPAALNALNAWVNEHTRGLIPHLIESLSPETDLVLANALAFKADWRSPFDASKTRLSAFTTASGEIVQAHFMNSSAVYQADQSGGSVAARFDFSGDGLYMVALLPDPSQTPDEAVDHLARVAHRFTPEHVVSVRVSLPKFDLTGGGDMRPALRSVGLGGLLDARLTRAALSGPQVSAVVQKVRVAADEQGAAAAAATAVFATRSLRLNEPPLVRFDRPFYFMILQDGAPAPLFAGYVASPL